MLERGTRHGSTAKLGQVAQALGIDLDDLLPD